MFGICFEYDDKWIKDHYADYPNNKELWLAYNETYGTEYKFRTFVSHLNREMGYGGNRNKEILYTKEQEDFLSKYYPLYGQNEVTKLFNDEFGTNKSVNVIKTKCQKMGLRVNSDVRQKHYRDKIRALNEHNLGDIWLGSDGFYHIKVSNEPYVKQSITCPRLHRYIWEKHNGKIPKGYKVIFLDNDISNCNIENLACVPSSYLALMNTYDMRSDNREITRTAVKWCELRTNLVKEGVEIGTDDE